MLACQLAIGGILFSMVLPARANYVNEELALCENYGRDRDSRGSILNQRMVEATFNGARYEGIQPKGTRSVTLKADCMASKLTGCAIKDSDNNPFSVDLLKQGDGCSDRFQLKAKDDSLKKCRLICLFKLKPIVACEGFVEDSVCLKASGAKSTADEGKPKSSESEQQTSIMISKALSSTGMFFINLDESKEIEYTADCSKKEIKQCGMREQGRSLTVDAKCNPFESNGCTGWYGMLVLGTTKRCRMCCFKYSAPTIICDG